MLRTRIIPALLLRGKSLVKTIKFGEYTYVGDPSNTVRIFNELEVDELIFLDITATLESRGPNMKILEEIVDECFMPLTYGGGVTSFNQVKDLLRLGFEKVAINSALAENSHLVRDLVEHFGSQAIIASVDVKKNVFNNRSVYTKGGRLNINKDPLDWVLELENLGIGELLLTSIDNEGTWSGFDLDLIETISKSVDIPVIVQGGAGNIQDLGHAKQAGASAIALGSMVVFQKKDMGVLINFPDKTKINEVVG